MTARIILWLPASLALLAGCSTPAPPPPTPATAAEVEESEEKYTRPNTAMTHVGKHHGYLTAHLSSKDGNRLELIIGTGHGIPPGGAVALPVEKITGRAKRVGDDTEYELIFEPAPAERRPKDEKPGTCSHFVAKTPWLKADDVLMVSVEVGLDGKMRRPTWRQFVPAKNATHRD